MEHEDDGVTNCSGDKRNRLIQIRRTYMSFCGLSNSSRFQVKSLESNKLHNWLNLVKKTKTKTEGYEDNNDRYSQSHWNNYKEPENETG